MVKCLIVGAGGAIGAICRYLLSTIPIKGNFPIITLITNLCGAIIIGVILGITLQNDLSPNVVLFTKVGFCGGFTTFSAFSLETLNLLENNHIMLGTIYAMSSVALCVIGVFAGRTIVGVLTRI